MKSISDIIIEDKINTDYEQYLLDELQIALHCWAKTGLKYELDYFVPHIFEMYKYNFSNCGQVVETIIDYLSDEKNIKDHNWTFKFDNIVFFDKLHIHFTLNNKSYYVKSKSKKNSVYLQINILNKPLDDYNIRERRFLIYTIIHELTHAYSDYLLRLEGKPSIIYLMKGNYEKEYRRAIQWMSPFTKNPSIKKLLGKCRYFLDEQEMIGYLGTVKETVKNVFNEIAPSYNDLKFSELLQLFSEEYIWSEYLEIMKFVENIDDIDKDKLVNDYKFVFNKDKKYDELINEIKNNWEIFKREFVEAFIEGYADCEEEMKLESFVSFDINYYQNPYKFL